MVKAGIRDLTVLTYMGATIAVNQLLPDNLFPTAPISSFIGLGVGWATRKLAERFANRNIDEYCRASIENLFNQALEVSQDRSLVWPANLTGNNYDERSIYSKLKEIREKLYWVEELHTLLSTANKNKTLGQITLSPELSEALASLINSSMEPMLNFAKSNSTGSHLELVSEIKELQIFSERLVALNIVCKNGDWAAYLEYI